MSLASKTLYTQCKSICNMTNFLIYFYRKSQLSSTAGTCGVPRPRWRRSSTTSRRSPSSSSTTGRPFPSFCLRVCLVVERRQRHLQPRTVSLGRGNLSTTSGTCSWRRALTSSTPSPWTAKANQGDSLANSWSPSARGGQYYMSRSVLFLYSLFRSSS